MSQFKATTTDLNGTTSSNQAASEVVARAKRRRFSAAYKLRILGEAEQCNASGQIGALLRCEGLYASHLSDWRRERDSGQLYVLVPPKPGRKREEQAVVLAGLRRENEQLPCPADTDGVHYGGAKKTCAELRAHLDPHQGQSLMVQAIEALAHIVPLTIACAAFDFPRSSIYRARQSQVVVEQPARPTPTRALSQAEQATVRRVLNSERFQDCSPRQVYATLLDEGSYSCSMRTMYRILDEDAENRERRNQAQHPPYVKPE